MMSLVLHDTTLSVAFHRVEQTLEEIAAVVTEPATLVADLEHVAALSTTAWEVMELWSVRISATPSLTISFARRPRHVACGGICAAGDLSIAYVLCARRGARSRKPAG